MCGINGIVSQQLSNAELAEKVQKMSDRMAHRGPDDQGAFISDGIGLGHRRLAILDLSPAGHQPMTDATGRYEIVFNGEIYNFKEIRKAIPEVTFKTESDTEVILAAYHKWGKEFLHQLNGMFAMAIWDKQTKKLFIARDRLGIKPLYYYKNEQAIVFGSEIRSLLASGLVPKKINTSALTDYFSYQTVHAPATIVKDVWMLMPGHYMEIEHSNISISCYWDLISKTSNRAAKQSYEEVCAETRELLKAAVKRRLISDVPFGAFLSGGIDSSIVVGLMSEVMSSPVKTFNITFEEGAFSEAVYARMIAEKFQTDHHEFKLTPGDFLSYLPAALQALDHPGGDGPNSWLVSKITRENGVTMALSGLGGDELFAGYPVFGRTLQIEKLRWMAALPGGLRKLLGGIAAAARPGVAGRKIRDLMELQDFSIANTFPVSRRTADRHHIAGILHVDLIADSTNTIIADLMQHGGDQLPVLSQVSVSEISTYMQNVLLRDTDQMSMASALEVRVPFLDYELVEYVLGVADQYKNPLFPKKLLVDSMKGLLPDEVVHRKKMGFTFPWEHWLKNELNDYCSTRIRALANRPYMNGGELLKRWELFMQGDRVRWPEMWICVVLEEWLTANGIEN